MIEELKIEASGGGEAHRKDTEYGGLGLAVASLVLGIISIPFSLMLVGGVCGLVGLVLAGVHLSKRYILRPMAWWGLGLSAVGLLLSLGFGIYVVSEVLEVRETMAMLEGQSFEEWIDAEAPEFTVTGLGGDTIRLSELKGRRVVLDFWATWCPPCRREIPHFVKLRNAYDVNDIFIIGISREGEEAIGRFRDKHRMNYPLAVEKDLPAPYADVTSLPTTFFIDREGIIRYVAEGYHDFEQLNTFVMGLERKADPNK